MHAARQSQLWLAACFPRLALESLAAASDEEATVVAQSCKGTARVIAANDAAAALGIGPKLKLSAAFALSESLNVLTRRTELERAKLAVLAERARQLTSVVSLEPPNVLLLEVGGSLKLFGGIEAIKASLADEFRRQRVTACCRVAPTPLAALWLARCGKDDVLSSERLSGSLSGLPLEATGWPEETQTLLKSMGVRTLGDCMRLPRGGFARRIGRKYLHEIDRSRGDHDPRQGLEPALQLDVHGEFGDETTSLAVLAHRGEQLIADLAENLRRHQVRISGFDCIFGHPDRSSTVERIGLVEPTRDPERLASVLAEKLERMHLAAPVLALSLRAGPTEPDVAGSGALFEDPHGADAESDRYGLIERLQARFGSESLYGMDLVDEHRPEAAWVKSRRFFEPDRRPPLAVGRSLPRPLWLLPAPRRLSRTADDLPRYEGREPLRVLDGPERIESGWWDGGEIGRDYYVACTAHGERLWIFQAHPPSRDWYLHGFFG